MRGIARVAQDTAGGPIIGGGNTRVFVDGTPASVIGDAVAGHGPDVHAGPVMVMGSFRVFAAGRPVCRLADTASCGHPATGSSRVLVG
jgi:uncharacterized Zn-binding protein involved in type VI secretion